MLLLLQNLQSISSVYLLGLEIWLCCSVSVLFTIKIINSAPFRVVRCVKRNCTSWDFFLGDCSEQFLFLFVCLVFVIFPLSFSLSLEIFARSRENDQILLHLLCKLILSVQLFSFELAGSDSL